jgi:hypothetical protein
MVFLNFFYQRISAGGFMVFDEYDYCAPAYPGAQKAINSFLVDKPEKIQRLPGAVLPRFFIQQQ